MSRSTQNHLAGCFSAFLVMWGLSILWHGYFLNDLKRIAYEYALSMGVIYGLMAVFYGLLSVGICLLYKRFAAKTISFRPAAIIGIAVGLGTHIILFVSG